MTALWCVPLVVLLCVMARPSYGEMFTAMADIERILYMEKEVAFDLRNFVLAERERLDRLDSLAADWEAHSEAALKDKHSFLANPVNTFLLVKRFTADWQKVEDLIHVNTSNVFLTEIQAKTENQFPGMEDYQGAADALVRLQDTYALNTSELARGSIQGVKYSPQLTAEDAFELGRLSYMGNDHYHCILWMQESYEILSREEEPTMDRATLLDYLSFSVYQQGNVQHAIKLTLEWLQEEPGHTRAINNLAHYHQLLGVDSEGKAPTAPSGELRNQRPLDGYRVSKEFNIYERLCRGEDTHEYPKKELKCHLRRHHPQFYIRPLKEEVFYLDPFIAVYHDLLSGEESDKIIELAQPKLHRSGVFTYDGGNQQPLTGYRTSKSAWLGDSIDPLVATVSLKVGAMSNLSLSTVEDLQVVNYGIGGHYEPHYDFARPEEMTTFDSKIANRIATAIFYITDVEAGGATVFPSIGVKLWPSKGACAFWWNLKRNGEGDYMTHHAGCPVLTGTKWVCNKWFHERGQEFTRPCALDPKV